MTFTEDWDRERRRQDLFERVCLWAIYAVCAAIVGAFIYFAPSPRQPQTHEQRLLSLHPHGCIATSRESATKSEVAYAKVCVDNKLAYLIAGFTGRIYADCAEMACLVFRGESL